MTVPARPHWQPQGPANRCIINGIATGWLNCTPTSFAMAAEKATLGKVRITGCDVRRQTGDTAGGTFLSQCATAIGHWGVHCDVYAGPRVVTPFWLAVQQQAGRGAVWQGNTSALIGTIHRSTGGGVNHAVYVNEVRGGSQGVPAEALVYDPAADGRVAGWGRAAQGPQWWPWSLLLKFAAALKPSGDQSTIRLGPGKVYCAVFADTEPHVHLSHGGQPSSPLPDHLTGKAGASLPARRIRPGPGPQFKPIGTLAVGASFVAYQWVNGPIVDGRQRWYGDHNGTAWISAAGIKGEGGT